MQAAGPGQPDDWVTRVRRNRSLYDETKGARGKKYVVLYKSRDTLLFSSRSQTFYRASC